MKNVAVVAGLSHITDTNKEYSLSTSDVINLYTIGNVYCNIREIQGGWGDPGDGSSVGSIISEITEVARSIQGSFIIKLCQVKVHILLVSRQDSYTYTVCHSNLVLSVPQVL